MSDEADLQETLDCWRKDLRLLLSLTAEDQDKFAAVVEEIERRRRPLTAERMRTRFKELIELIEKWNNAPEPQSYEDDREVMVRCGALLNQLSEDLTRGFVPR
jgi:hypothetical protein